MEYKLDMSMMFAMHDALRRGSFRGPAESWYAPSKL